ncbi:hypothetical protein BX600DRAFT_537024 [Xylariales sp. PMI_506]|nr:hypothetical protein BX600DRAFT_537024 [Xylariales sp. PMI_506]
MPQFIFVELPSFNVKDRHGHSVTLSSKQLGLVIALYHYVRSGLATATGPADLSASLLFASGDPDLWTSANSEGSGGLHAEENLLLSYFQSFDSPGAYPIVDAMMLSTKPCHGCSGYFEQSGSGKHLRPGVAGLPAAFRAKFTARSDRSHTPVFYLARGLDPESRAALWAQLATVWSSDLAELIASSAEVPRGQAYFLLEDSPWYALNGQESMTDAEIAQAIQAQGALPTYWIGR